jgi:hypothetical protein
MESSSSSDETMLSVSNDHGYNTAAAAVRALLATLLTGAATRETDTLCGLLGARLCFITR